LSASPSKRGDSNGARGDVKCKLQEQSGANSVLRVKCRKIEDLNAARGENFFGKMFFGLLITLNGWSQAHERRLRRGFELTEFR
jgi:hypothetical protein